MADREKKRGGGKCKIWMSQEWKELFRWNTKAFFIVLKGLAFGEKNSDNLIKSSGRKLVKDNKNVIKKVKTLCKQEKKKKKTNKKKSRKNAPY